MFAPFRTTILAAAAMLIVALTACHTTNGVRSASEEPMLRAHAHNDYAHERPLLDALEHRFHSIEADVWLDGGMVMVSHDPGINPRGTLEELYVAPLARRVREQGSVYGNGHVVQLWIDLKEDSGELLDAVHAILTAYPDVFMRYTDGTMDPAPIEAILTGSRVAKTRYCEEYEVRFASRDGPYDPAAPPADDCWRWCALHWRSNVDWDGVGEIPPEELKRLREIVRGVHDQGRRIRFWATPETEEFWTLAREEGLDLINTDHLAALRSFLERHGASRP